MNWEERRKKYQKLLALGGENDENLIARHILNGLGFREKDITELEKQFLCETFLTLPLWDRVKSVLVAICRTQAQKTHNMNSRLIHTKEQLEVVPYSLKTKDAPIFDRISIWAQSSNEITLRPFLFVRVPQTKTAVVYYPFNADEINRYLVENVLRPPFKIIKKITKEKNTAAEYIIQQSIKNFVKGACYID